MAEKAYAYIASGQDSGSRLMKVGKTINPKQRAVQIGMSIHMTLACIDEASAFKIEAEMRNLVIAQGGIRYRRILDYFIFDERIFDLLKTHLLEQKAHFENDLSHIREMTPDEEIELYRSYYFELLITEVTAERDLAVSQLAEAQKLLNEKTAAIDALIQEIALVPQLGEDEG